MAAVARVASVAAVAVGAWASGVAAPGPSSRVTSLRGFGVTRDLSLNHLLRPLHERLGVSPRAFATLPKLFFNSFPKENA